MSVFGDYSNYYNLLYKDKDYGSEADFVLKQIRAHTPSPATLLNLGCGTAGHDIHFARQGLTVLGVDLSADMLAMAEERTSEPGNEDLSLSVAKGDVRSYRCGESFDAVVSLFHVMSYQQTNQDLLDAFKTAYAHLSPGGIFLFDCWFGPAVLTDRPEVRTKELEDEYLHVTRLAEPVMHAARNLVDVNYTVTIREKDGGREEVLKETHTMRYLFLPEMEYFLNQTGFELLEAREWMTGREPGFDTWSVYLIARA